MQKIQFYLVPNRITVTTDLVGYNTEYRQVYQRKIKLHKGIDNTLEIEVKNSDQRREDVVGKTVVVKFFDAARQNLFTVDGEAIVSKPGLMTVTVAAEDIASIDPQMLTLAAYLTDGTTDQILYADSQFDVLAHVEIFDGYNAAPDFTDELTVFNYERDAMKYVSEIGSFGKAINEDYDTAPIRSVTVEVYPNDGFNGDIVVYATKDKSTSFGTVWKQLGTMTIDAATHVPGTDTYTFSGDYKLVRFQFNKYNPTVTAPTADSTLTGTLDKIIIRN